MTTLRENSNKIVLEILGRYIGKTDGEVGKMSLRGFATRVGIPASSLSEIRRGLARPSRKIISKLVQAGVLSEKDCNTLKVLFGAETDCNPPASLAFQKQLTPEEFRELGAWYAPVIIELIKSHSPMGISAEDISSRIEIDLEQTQVALDKIERMSLIAKSDRLLYTALEVNITTSDNIPNEFVRDVQKNILHKAIESVDRIDASERDNLSLILSLSPERLPEIKNLLRDFVYQINAMDNSAQKPNEVYSLSIALFPLTIASKEKNHVTN